MKAVFAALALIVLAAPCQAAAKARLYNLRTGEVTQIEYKNGFFRGHGPMWGVMPDGRKIKGEFTTVGYGSSTWGKIYSEDGGVSVDAGDANAQRGSAVLIGDGFTLECEYLTRPGAWLSSHGTGSCRDNQGTRYRLIF
jgi:hypothetical protein